MLNYIPVLQGTSRDVDADIPNTGIYCMEVAEMLMQECLAAEMYRFRTAENFDRNTLFPPRFSNPVNSCYANSMFPASLQPAAVSECMHVLAD